MTAAQSTYKAGLAIGIPGMIANMELLNSISRTANGNIGFGQPVIRVGDHNCVLASLETLEATDTTTDDSASIPAAATIGSISVAYPAKEGKYRITCFVGGSATASKWNVQDPDGNIIGVASGATAFSEAGLSFTIADPGTDPVVGEQFVLTVAPSEATDDLDVIGLSILDTTLVHTTPDRYEQYDSVGVMTRGVMFVTAGASVSAGDDVYWIAASGKYTNVAGAGNLRIPNAKFDTGGADTEIVKVALSMAGGH